MSISNPKPAWILSGIICVLMIVASAGGLYLQDLYRDNFLVTSSWQGNDLVTLLIASPLMIVATLMAKKGSLCARLIWLGMLDYVLYNFSFYLFGAAFNALFLVYVALVTLSVFALILGLATLDVIEIAEQFRKRTPIKGISGYMMLVALFLGGFWISLSLNYLFTGQVPQMIINVDHPTNVTGALDLSMVVSVFILGAVWLWQRKPWGYVLAAIINVKGAVYMLALTASTITAFQTGAAHDVSLAFFWALIGLGCLVCCLFLLGNLDDFCETDTQRG